MKLTSAPRPDLAHIRSATRVLLEQGAVTEVRVPKTDHGTISGYFNDAGRLIHAAETLNCRGDGVYMTLNPVDPALLARANNRVVRFAAHTTGDKDILSLRWLLIDIDAVRPSGISSTDGEHRAALNRAFEIRDFLTANHFPRESLLVADSGNGAHVLLRVDLRNAPDSSDILSRCLQGLDLLFSDASAHVDTRTYNAARLAKVYGTAACKGDSTADRPHRLARLLEVPDRLIPAPRRALELIAARAPAADRRARPMTGGAFDLDAWIAQHDLPVVRSGPWGDGGWKWVLSPCPWNPQDHTDRAAYIVRLGNGAIAAGCHHQGCAGRGWPELRALYQPDSVNSVRAEGHNWEEPLPLPDLVGPAFPVDALPGELARIVGAHAEAVQVPAGLSATLALGALAAAATGRLAVRPRPDWREQVSLFTVTVLPSGERKSPAFGFFMAPVERRECELLTAAAPEFEERRTQLNILQRRREDAERRAAKAAKNGDSEPEHEARRLAREEGEFRLSLVPRLLADDATSEAVASLLAQHGGRITVASTEGGLFETLAGRYSDHIPNLDVYLKGYSGDALRVDRTSRSPEHVPHPALTLVLTVQPEVMYSLKGRTVLRGRGLLARFLYQIPQSLVGYRKSDPLTMPEQVALEWDTRVDAILRLPEPLEGEQHTLRLSESGAAAFREFREHVELRLRPGGELWDIVDWANKMPGHVLRIAACLHLWKTVVEWQAGGPLPWEVPVSDETIEQAVRLGEHYAQHAAVAFSMIRDGGATVQARTEWEYIAGQRWQTFTVRDLWRRRRRSYERVAELEAVLATLVEHHYLVRRVTSPREGPGRPPSPIYAVNPLAMELVTEMTKTSAPSDSVNSVTAEERDEGLTSGPTKGDHPGAVANGGTASGAAVAQVEGGVGGRDSGPASGRESDASLRTVRGDSEGSAVSTGDRRDQAAGGETGGSGSRKRVSL